MGDLYENKKLLAVVSSVIAILACNISHIYSREIYKTNETLEISSYSDNMSITKFEYDLMMENAATTMLEEKLTDFINEQNFDTKVFINTDYDYIYDDYYRIKLIVIYHYTNTNVKPAIEKFIKDNNYDSKNVSFQAIGNDGYDTSDKITDLYEMAELIESFALEEGFFACVGISDNSFTIHLSSSEDAKKISDFMEEKNIREYCKGFFIDE